MVVTTSSIGSQLASPPMEGKKKPGKRKIKKSKGKKNGKGKRL